MWSIVYVLGGTGDLKGSKGQRNNGRRRRPLKDQRNNGCRRRTPRNNGCRKRPPQGSKQQRPPEVVPKGSKSAKIMGFKIHQKMNNGTFSGKNKQWNGVEGFRNDECVLSLHVGIHGWIHVLSTGRRDRELPISEEKVETFQDYNQSSRVDGRKTQNFRLRRFQIL